MYQSIPSRFQTTLIVLWLFVSATSVVAQSVSGVVYEDVNQNGLRDSGEQGIEGVLVSNQIEVTVTDGNGRYELPAREEMVVFVTQPVDYRVPVDEHQLPQFYYVHDANGSSPDINWKYETLQPTGPLPESIDFPLIPEKHKNPFRMIAMADPQPRDNREIDYIREDVMPQMVNVDANLVIVHGDIMFDDLSLFDRQNELFSSIGAPVWYVPGNHDMNLRAKGDYESMETFRRVFGPTYYSHDYAQVHFMTLENIHYRGRGYQSPDGKGRKYRGYLDADQLTWIENDLQHVPAEKLVVLSTHIPFKAFQGNGEDINTVNREALFKLLEGREYVLLLSGHTHTNDHVYIGVADGWHGDEPLHNHILGTVSGSWWLGPLDQRGIPATTMRDGAENCFHVYTFDGTDYTSVYVPASMDPDYQIRVSLEVGDHDEQYRGQVFQMTGELGNIIQIQQVPQATVVANVFNGGEKTLVTLSVDDGEPFTMKRVFRYDPSFVEVQERLKKSREQKEFRYWGRELSSHLWEGSLPSGLQAGAHTLHVNAIDQYGQTLMGTKVFEIVVP